MQRLSQGAHVALHVLSSNQATMAAQPLSAMPTGTDDIICSSAPSLFRDCLACACNSTNSKALGPENSMLTFRDLCMSKCLSYRASKTLSQQGFLTSGIIQPTPADRRGPSNRGHQVNSLSHNLEEPPRETSVRTVAGCRSNDATATAVALCDLVGRVQWRRVRSRLLA
jgi:hypothetical protein